MENDILLIEKILISYKTYQCTKYNKIMTCVFLSIKCKNVHIHLQAFLFLNDYIVVQCNSMSCKKCNVWIRWISSVPNVLSGGCVHHGGFWVRSSGPRSAVLLTETQHGVTYCSWLWLILGKSLCWYQVI